MKQISLLMITLLLLSSFAFAQGNTTSTNPPEIPEEEDWMDMSSSAPAAAETSSADGTSSYYVYDIANDKFLSRQEWIDLPSEQKPTSDDDFEARFAGLTPELYEWVQDTDAKLQTLNNQLLTQAGINLEDPVWISDVVEQKGRQAWVLYDNVRTRTKTYKDAEGNTLAIVESSVELDMDGNPIDETQTQKATIPTRFGFNIQSNFWIEEDGERKQVSYNVEWKDDGAISTFKIDGEAYDYDPKNDQWKKDHEWVDFGELPEEWRDKYEESPQAERDQVNAQMGAAEDAWDALNVMADNSPFALSFMAAFVKGRQMMSGFRQFYRANPWIGGFDAESIQKRKQQLQDRLCIMAGIRGCATSLFCDDPGTIDYAPEGGAVIRDSHGLPEMGAYVKATKLGPFKVRGASRQTLIDIFGDSAVIQNQVYNFADPGFNTYSLPVDVEAYLYQVNYFVNNPGTYYTNVGSGWLGNPTGRKDLKWNLQFRGDNNDPKWFADNNVLRIGESNSSVIFKYSFNDYEKVCLTLSPPLAVGGQSEVLKFDEVCDTFEVYSGKADDANTEGGDNDPAVTTAGPGAGI